MRGRRGEEKLAGGAKAQEHRDPRQHPQQQVDASSEVALPLRRTTCATSANATRATAMASIGTNDVMARPSPANSSAAPPSPQGPTADSDSSAAIARAVRPSAMDRGMPSTRRCVATIQRAGGMLTAAVPTSTNARVNQSMWWFSDQSQPTLAQPSSSSARASTADTTGNVAELHLLPAPLWPPTRASAAPVSDGAAPRAARGTRRQQDKRQQ